MFAERCSTFLERRVEVLFLPGSKLTKTTRGCIKGALGEEKKLDANSELGLIESSVRSILESPVFRSSKQCQVLLRYIVDHSLASEDALLRERVIGTAVFGRAPDYDSGNDPVVRARVNEVRKRLAQYYEGHRDNTPVRISIPSGSYRAVFEMAEMRAFESPSQPSNGREESPAEEPPGTAVSHGAAENPEEVPPIPRAPRWRVWGITAVVTCSLLLATSIVVAKWPKSELDLLWKPILDSKKTVLLYTGTVGPLYRHSADPIDGTNSAGDRELPATPPSLSQVETQAPNAGVFVPVAGYLAPPGDIAADLKIAALMNSYNRNLSLRSGQGLQFADLKGSPTVLIGAYDNYWTVDLARELPFFLDRGVRIRERGGQHRVWASVAGADSAITEDYAIVFRLLDSKTGGPVIAIAGLTTCGTQAAAEFVTDPVQLKKLATIPRDALERKNLEFVLRASLVNCTPASEEIVAIHYW